MGNQPAKAIETIVLLAVGNWNRQRIGDLLEDLDSTLRRFLTSYSAPMPGAPIVHAGGVNDGRRRIHKSAAWLCSEAGL
jgi:hypothetical protein